MRDIAVTLAFLAFWIPCFVRPYLGPLLWAWVSMMYPHRLAFGFAHDLPVASVAAVTTLAAFAVTKEKHPFPRNGVAVLLAAYFGWVTITALASFNDPEMVFDVWVKVAKIQLMLFVTMMLLSGRRHLVLLVWVIALSLGFYGLKGGIHTLMKGGQGLVQGPPGSFIEPNNELGVALIMVVPLLYFLYGISRDKWIRRGILAVALFTLVAILGTFSRGAFLGAAVMAVFLGLKSNRRALTAVLVAATLVGAVAVMPEKWTARMQSISSHQDSSAQTRLQVWRISTRIALDHPLVGGGYRITENPRTWERYAEGEWKVAFAPHSIYFQVLAEHGFVGLFLYLAIGIATWRLASKAARQARSGPDADWAPLLMDMIQVSMVGFAVAGAFLSLANYDLPYYLAAIVAMAARDVQAGRVPVPRFQAGALAAPLR